MFHCTLSSRLFSTCCEAQHVELQHKYESKVEQRCGCDLKVLTTTREDNVGSALIPKEELGEEMKVV